MTSERLENSMQRYTNQLLNVKYFNILLTKITAWRLVLMAGAELKNKK
jgi:hypothetical protein